MDEESLVRFRKAYWQAVRDLDWVRLQQWERWRLTLPQLRVLQQLRRSPGSTTGELARTLGITVSTTSGLVIKLADRGLIARSTVAGDRRQLPLHLTPEGEALIGELVEVSRPFLASVATALDDEIGGVTLALERLARAAEEARREVPVEPAAGNEPPRAPLRAERPI